MACHPTKLPEGKWSDQAHPKEMGTGQGEVRIQGELKEQAGTEGVKGRTPSLLGAQPQCLPQPSAETRLNKCAHRGSEPRREAGNTGRVTSFIIPKCKVLKALAITWRGRGEGKEQEAKSTWSLPSLEKKKSYRARSAKPAHCPLQKIKFHSRDN